MVHSHLRRERFIVEEPPKGVDADPGRTGGEPACHSVDWLWRARGWVPFARYAVERSRAGRRRGAVRREWRGRRAILDEEQRADHRDASDIRDVLAGELRRLRAIRRLRQP